MAGVFSVSANRRNRKRRHSYHVIDERESLVNVGEGEEVIVISIA